MKKSMDSMARALAEFDKIISPDDRTKHLAFYASEDIQVGMLARLSPDAEDGGLVIPVTQDTFQEPWLGPVVFVCENVAMVRIAGAFVGEAKFPLEAKGE